MLTPLVFFEIISAHGYSCFNSTLMKTSRVNRFLDNIFDVMLAVDDDHTMTLSEKDVHELIQRVKRIQNVTIHEEPFKKAIEKNGNSIDAVFRILNDCLDGNPATDPIEGVEIISFE